MKRILVMAALLIAVFIFSGCYTPRGVVRPGANRYYAPRTYGGSYGGFGYHGGAHYYGGGHRSYQGGGHYGGHHR